MQAVSASNLKKVYATGKEAVAGVSFTIEPGEIFGFLGPNGAGKTTTVKVLTGMLTASGGTCSVFGADPGVSPEIVHGMAGVVTEHAQMYDNMSGLQNLTFFGALFGVPDSECKARAKELLSRIGLSDAADKKLLTYSTGMRQRLSLARALIHRPRILFLDEPTSGLDPESVKDVNDMIKRMAAEDGTTVFLCTHQLRYAEEICSSYGLVDNGYLLAYGTLQSLRASVSSGFTLEVKADRMPDGIEFKRAEDGTYRVYLTSENEIPGIARRIVESGAELYHLSARQLSLEEIYFALIEQQRAKGPRLL